MKKQNVVSLSLVMFLMLANMTACQKQEGGEGQPGKETDVQSEQEKELQGENGKKETDSASSSSFIPLKVEKTEDDYYVARVSGSADLDFDGKEEEIDFKADLIHYEDSGPRVERGQFLLDGEVFNLREICAPARFSWMDESAKPEETSLAALDVVDLDPQDNKREMIVYKQIPTHGIPYYIAEFFHYENGSFVSLGEIDTGYLDTMAHESFDPNEKTLSFDGEGYSLCNFYFVETYQLQKNKIVNITKEEKEMFVFDQEGENKVPIVTKVIGTARVYGSPNWEKVIYELQPGDEVTFLSTVLCKWVKIRVSNGRVGYLKNICSEGTDENDYGQTIFDDDPEKFPNDVFEDLPAWG